MRVSQPLRRRRAAAHHGHQATVQHLGLAGCIQQQRRVGRVQQGRRVAGVAQGQHMTIGRTVEPAPRGVEAARKTFRGCGQGLRHRGTHVRSQRRRRGVEEGFRRAKGRQQAAGRVAANAGGLQQTQPGSKFVRGQHGQGPGGPRSGSLGGWQPG